MIFQVFFSSDTRGCGGIVLSSRSKCIRGIRRRGSQGTGQPSIRRLDKVRSEAMISKEAPKGENEVKKCAPLKSLFDKIKFWC